MSAHLCACVNYIRCIIFAGEKAKIEKLVQMAWTFMNDRYNVGSTVYTWLMELWIYLPPSLLTSPSLCTSLCLQWEPQPIAIAFIYLAGKLSKFDLHTATQSRSRSWWRQYLDTLDVHDLESICHQVLDIYGEEEVSHVLLCGHLDHATNTSSICFFPEQIWRRGGCDS